MFVATVLMSSAAYGQTTPVAAGECFPSSHIDKVVVEMKDGTTKRGALLCLGPGSFTLAERQSVGSFELDAVQEIRKAADPVWDGAAKGASVGLVLLALCAGHCPAEAVVRTAVGYGVFGLVLDAIDTNRDTIYRPANGRRLAAAFRLKF
jgi:hypothetical protein